MINMLVSSFVSIPFFVLVPLVYNDAFKYKKFVIGDMRLKILKHT